MKTRSADWTDHPELQDGEMFLTNASDEPLAMTFDDDVIDNRSDWEAIGWETKRRGSVAYDVNGNSIPGMFPVFVKREELARNGVEAAIVMGRARPGS